MSWYSQIKIAEDQPHVFRQRVENAMKSYFVMYENIGLVIPYVVGVSEHIEIIAKYMRGAGDRFDDIRYISKERKEMILSLSKDMKERSLHFTNWNSQTYQAMKDLANRTETGRRSSDMFRNRMYELSREFSKSVQSAADTRMLINYSKRLSNTAEASANAVDGILEITDIMESIGYGAWKSLSKLKRDLDVVSKDAKYIATALDQWRSEDQDELV